MKPNVARCLIVVSSAACSLAACAPDDPAGGFGSDTPTSADLARVSLALTSVPTGVNCLRLDHEVGTRRVESKVGVTPGAASALVTFPGLAPGACLLTVEGFSQSCGSVSASTLP